MADELPPLIAQLVGDAGNLFGVLDDAEARLTAFANQNFDANVGIDGADAVEETIAAIDSLLEALDDVVATPLVDVDTLLAQAHLASLDATIAKVKADLIMGQLELDDAEALAKVEALKEQILTIDDLVPVVDINTSIAQAKLAALDATIAGLKADAVLSGVTGGGGGGGGGAVIPVVTGGGSGGGGGGAAGLLAALGFGSKASGGVFGIGAGLAGFGSLGAMAGLGPESVLATGAGLLGSGAGALLGGGALAAGALGVGAVGMGTDLAGIGQAAGDIKSTYTAMSNLNQAIAVYGKGSVQAATAQAQLNYTLSSFSPLAKAAVVQAANTANQFHAMFNAATGGAESTGAQIINQLMQVGEKFLPTIGKFAGENMKIIQTSMQPLLTWIQGPGLTIFTKLEQTFQNSLPTAMHAFSQAIELIIKTLGFLAPYTGRFIKELDKIFTELNGKDFGKFTGEIAKAIGIFRDWEKLIKAVGTAIYEIFHNDAGTGTAIVNSLTQMVNKFNDWIKVVANGKKVNAYLEAHKNEILSILKLLPPLISIFGQMELTVAPVLMKIVTLLVKLTDALFKVPFVGTVGMWIAAIAILSSKSVVIGGLVSGIFNLGRTLRTAGVYANIFHGYILQAFDKIGAFVSGLFGIGEAGAAAAAGEDAVTASAVPMDAALDANPIGVIAIAIAALGVGLYELVQHFTAVSDFLNGTWGTAISAAVAAVFPMIGIPMLIIGHWRGVLNFFEHDLPHAFTATVSFLRSGLGTLVIALTGPIAPLLLLALHWKEVWNALPQVASSAWAAIETVLHTMESVWNNVISFFASIPSRVMSALASLGGLLLGWATRIMAGLWSGIQTGWHVTLNFFTNIDKTIGNFFSGAGRWLFDIGAKIITGLWDGLKSVWHSVTSWFGSLGGIIKSIKGPPAADAVMLVENGQLIMQGFAQGLRNGWQSHVLPALSGMNTQLAGSMHSNISLGGAGGISPVSATSGSSTTVLHVTSPITVDGKVLAQVTSQYQLQYARRTGNVSGRFAGSNQSGTATRINTNAIAR